jgi:hypothetical protein
MERESDPSNGIPMGEASTTVLKAIRNRPTLAKKIPSHQIRNHDFATVNLNFRGFFE